MRRAESPTDLGIPRCSLGVVGAAVDGRGILAIEQAKHYCERLLQISFLPNESALLIDGATVQLDDFRNIIALSGGPVLLEATTLGFVEIALTARLLNESKVGPKMLTYLEPREYLAPSREEILQARDFALSEQVQAYSGVPGWIRRIDPIRARVVFLLGFEGQRLAQAVEQLPLSPRNCSVVFGVPAYRPGWEMNAFANNIAILRENLFAGGVDFCAADNPLAVMQLLKSKFEVFTPNADVFVVPIGTKPHGIGAALFAASNPQIGLIYDNPIKKKGRSSEAGVWHLFTSPASNA